MFNQWNISLEYKNRNWPIIKYQEYPYSVLEWQIEFRKFIRPLMSGVRKASLKSAAYFYPASLTITCIFINSRCRLSFLFIATKGVEVDFAIYSKVSNAKMVWKRARSITKWYCRSFTHFYAHLHSDSITNSINSSKFNFSK